MYPCRLRVYVCVCLVGFLLMDSKNAYTSMRPGSEYRECNENDGPIFVFKNFKRNDARSFLTLTHKRTKTVYKICFVCLVLGEQPSLKCGLRFDTMISFG